MSKQAFICDAIRTPFGRYGGALSSVRTDDLAAIPLKALMARNAAVEMMKMIAPSRRARISGPTRRDSHRLLNTLFTIIRSNTESVSCSSEP